MVCQVWLMRVCQRKTATTIASEFEETKLVTSLRLFQ